MSTKTERVAGAKPIIRTGGTKRTVRERADRGARPVFRAHMTHLAERMLGEEVTGFEFPGGSRRDSCRLTLRDGRSVIATVREEPHRAALEANVLAALTRVGAPAPRVLADNGRVLIQEDRGVRRLSVALHEADAEGAADLLSRALASLCELHAAGRAAGLAGHVPVLGVDDDWIETLIDRPRATASLLELPVPQLKEGTLRDLLGVLDPTFIKWDARPANAVIDEAGAITWIDFEHCGARNPLDDLAWVLADETVPLDPKRDEALVAWFAPRFGGSLPEDMRLHYAWVMATLHGTHRLNLMLNSALNDDRGWRDPDECIRRDSVGVARDFAVRQCRRLAHFARRSSLTEELGGFYLDCAASLPE